MAKLQLLRAIDSRLEKMNMFDIAALDSAQLLVLLESFISEVDKNSFAGLSPSQLKKFTNTGIQKTLKDELSLIIKNDIEKIKSEKIIKLITSSVDSALAYTILKGNITMNSSTLLQNSKVRIVEQQSGKIINYTFLNPDGTYIALLESGKDYTLILQAGELLPEKIKLDLSKIKGLSLLPLYYQQISLTPISAFDEIIGQQLIVNSGGTEIIEYYDSSLALSNISIYGLDKKSGLIPVSVGNDTIYTLDNSNKKLSSFSYNKLAQLISSLNQMETIDTMSKAELIELLKASKLYDYRQLSQIISTIELMSEKDIHNKSKMADIIAKTIMKLQLLELEKLEVEQLENIANITFEEVLSREMSGINVQDSSSLAANKFTLIMNTQIAENKKRDSVIQKFSSFAKLRALEKINQKLSQMPIAELAALDSAALAWLLKNEIETINITESGEFTDVQKKYLEKSDAKQIAALSIEKFTAPELEKIKYAGLAQHFGQSTLQGKQVLVSGKIIDPENKASPKTQILVVEKISHQLLKEIYYPDSNGNYFLMLDPDKEYDVIVKKDGFIPERFSLNISKDKELSKLPYILQQIEIKPVSVYNDTIGQELLVSNSGALISENNAPMINSNLNIYSDENNSSLEPVFAGDDTLYAMPANFISIRGKYSRLPQEIATMILLNEGENVEKDELLELVGIAMSDLKVKNISSLSEQELKLTVARSIEKQRKQKEAIVKANNFVNAQAQAILMKHLAVLSKQQLENQSEKNISELLIVELKKSNNSMSSQLTKEQYEKIIVAQSQKLISGRMKSMVDARLDKINQSEIKKTDDEYLASVISVKTNKPAVQPFVYKLQSKDTTKAIAMAIPVVAIPAAGVISTVSNNPAAAVIKDTVLSPAEKIFIVYFDYDKSDVNNQYIMEMENVISYTRSLSAYNIEIYGHTDAKGSDDYNLRLSKSRASAAGKYFIAKGLKKNKIKVFGFGESRPLAPNALIDGSDNPQGRQKNRRAEIKVKQLLFKQK